MSSTQEKLTKRIYEIMAMPYPSERHDAFVRLIDSAKREGEAIYTYKNGFYGACGVCGLTRKQADYAWEKYEAGMKNPKIVAEAIRLAQLEQSEECI